MVAGSGLQGVLLPLLLLLGWLVLQAALVTKMISCNGDKEEEQCVVQAGTLWCVCVCVCVCGGGGGEGRGGCPQDRCLQDSYGCGTDAVAGQMLAGQLRLRDRCGCRTDACRTVTVAGQMRLQDRCLQDSHGCGTVAVAGQMLANKLRLQGSCGCWIIACQTISCVDTCRTVAVTGSDRQCSDRHYSCSAAPATQLQRWRVSGTLTSH
jgi:hypothetical protein